MEKEHHVVIVGGGFGGLGCAKALRRAGVRVTLIDQRNHHLFQPLLYQVATTILPTSEIAWPLRRLFRGRSDVTTLMAEVTGVDRADKRIRIADGSTLGFDSLVLATGATHSYFGNDDWEQHAPGLKTLEDATTIRRRLLSAFEYAERCDDPAKQQAFQTFVVIGAGPTGVELAGIIGDLARRVLPREFRRIDTRASRVLLVEAGPRVLAAFPEALSDYAERALTKLGVEVLKGQPVTHCDNDGIVIDGERIHAATKIWAAGVKGSAAGGWLDAGTDRAGRVVVEPDLSVPGSADIFVIGDTAAVTDASGEPVPGIAPAAKQQGVYVANVIRRRVDAKPAPKPFRYRHAGNLATIGPSAAVGDFGWLKMKGFVAWWIWGIAHIYFLIGTRSRIAVAYSWLWSYLTGQNSARLITQGQLDEEKSV
ncbi:MAG: NAD(P)/FAD-dependent oxidoreductase [Pseudomonadota bacterium]